MVEMDISDTEFDPTLDEYTWNVTIVTATKEYAFKGVETAQKDALRKLGEGWDYVWSDDERGIEDFIWAKPVERVIVSRGKTKREIKREADWRRDRALRRRY